MRCSLGFRIEGRQKTKARLEAYASRQEALPTQKDECRLMRGVIYKRRVSTETGRRKVLALARSRELGCQKLGQRASRNTKKKNKTGLLIAKSERNVLAER